MEQPMKFSIIIPAHDSAKYITKALDSISQQTYSDYELIVVCDSCSDQTEAMAKQWEAKTIVTNFNCDGPARNAGLDAATGDWVLFMDDDDWWLHEFVLEQLANKVGNEDEDILVFSFVWKYIGYAKPFTPQGDYYPAVWNKCWRREFIGDTRFPNLYSISDYYFHLNMMAKHPKIVTWDMPMYYYNYLRKGSISEQMGRTAKETKEYWSKF